VLVKVYGAGFNFLRSSQDECSACAPARNGIFQFTLLAPF
jgi:hypothetical protein